MSEKRGAFARIGIVLLNLLAIGLGLLRLGRWQMAVVLFGVSALILIFLNFAAPFPIALLLTAVISWVAAYILAFWLSWRFSKTRQANLKWYQRWYTVVIAGIAALAISAPLTNRNHLRYRSFYIPSESMAPTLEKNDRLFAYMRPPQQLHRGDLVLVTAPGGTIYIKRIAALPDDRISMSNGVVILNDVPVPQRMVDKKMVEMALAGYLRHGCLSSFPARLARIRSTISAQARLMIYRSKQFNRVTFLSWAIIEMIQPTAGFREILVD